MFSPRPGRTNLIQHHIDGAGRRSAQPAVSFTGTKKKVVQSELEAMLEMGVIEESHSDWASPIVWYRKQTARSGSAWIIAR